MTSSPSFHNWILNILKDKIDVDCKWRVTLLCKGNPVWTTEKNKKVWMVLFKGILLRMEDDWWSIDPCKLNHVFKFRALKHVSIDEAMVELFEKKTLIYSRNWQIPPLVMEPSDQLDLNFELKLEQLNV